MPSRSTSVRVVSVALALACLSPLRAARADGGAAGGDAVFLKNGGVVRGTIIEAVPDRPARVQLSTGEVTTIPWGDVDHVSAGAAAAGAAPKAEAKAERGPEVRLHVEAPPEVEIVGRPNETFDWTLICTSPCDKMVPEEWEYQARGDGVRPSRPTLLRPQGGRANLRVDPASNRAFVGGLVAFIGGDVLASIGLTVTAVGAVGHYNTTDSNGVTVSHQVDSSVLPAGLVILGVAAVAAIGGGVLAFTNWSTGMHQDGAGAGAAAPLPTQRFLDVAREGPKVPPPASTPIVTLRF